MSLTNNLCQFSLCSLMSTFGYFTTKPMLENVPMDIIRYIIKIMHDMSQNKLYRTQDGFTIHVGGKSLVFNTQERCEYYGLKRIEKSDLYTSTENKLIIPFTYFNHNCAMVLKNGSLWITEYFITRPMSQSNNLIQIKLSNVTTFAIVFRVLFMVSDDKLYYVNNEPSTDFEHPKLINLSGKVKFFASSEERLVVITDKNLIYTVRTHSEIKLKLIDSSDIKNPIIGLCCTLNMIIVYTLTNVYLFGVDGHALVNPSRVVYNKFTQMQLSINNMKIQKICCSSYNVFIVLVNGVTLCHGTNYGGQAGALHSTIDSNKFRETFVGKNVMDIICHDHSTMIITYDGSVYYCGLSPDGTFTKDYDSLQKITTL